MCGGGTCSLNCGLPANSSSRPPPSFSPLLPSLRAAAGPEHRAETLPGCPDLPGGRPARVRTTDQGLITQRPSEGKSKAEPAPWSQSCRSFRLYSQSGRGKHICTGGNLNSIIIYFLFSLTILQETIFRKFTVVEKMQVLLTSLNFHRAVISRQGLLCPSAPKPDHTYYYIW